MGSRFGSLFITILGNFWNEEKSEASVQAIAASEKVFTVPVPVAAEEQIQSETVTQAFSRAQNALLDNHSDCEGETESRLRDCLSDVNADLTCISS